MNKKNIKQFSFISPDYFTFFAGNLILNPKQVEKINQINETLVQAQAPSKSMFVNSNSVVKYS